MAAWKEDDFDYAARRLSSLLRDHFAGMCWSYENSCLLSSATRKTPGSHLQVSNGDDELQSTCDVPFYDIDAIALSNSHVTEWSFSVVYSHIWHVPVLYFTVQMQDGTPLTRNEVIDSLHSYCSDPDSFVHTSDFVTIDEHPVTGSPSYFLHPCQTLRRMEIFTHQLTCPALRLWSWMSMLFPTVGIMIPLNTFSLIQSELRGTFMKRK
jgi:ubiquitin-like-conjugating enzyme ATG10